MNTNNFDYVVPVLVNQREPYMFKWSEEQQNWVPSHPIKQFVDLEENEYSVTKSELIPEEFIS